MNAQRVRDAFTTGLVTDGASERCEFVEITNEQTGEFVTVDARSLSTFSDDNFNQVMQAIRNHLGVE